MAKTNASVRYKSEIKRKQALISAIVLFLIGLVMLFLGTYTYYNSQVTGTVNGTIAVWVFKANDATTSFRINLEPSQNVTATYTNAYSEQVKTIAPGTSGSFSIELSTIGSGLAVNYEITFSTFTNKPSNLKFYSDSGFNNETDITASGYKIQGSLSANSTTTETIYWQWPYGNSGSITSDNAAADKPVSFNLNVVGQQAQ